MKAAIVLAVVLGALLAVAGGSMIAANVGTLQSTAPADFCLDCGPWPIMRWILWIPTGMLGLAVVISGIALLRGRRRGVAFVASCVSLATVFVVEQLLVIADRGFSIDPLGLAPAAILLVAAALVSRSID